MTTYSLFLDSSSQASATEVVGPSGPSGSFTIDDDYEASNGAVIDAAGGSYTIALPENGGTVTVRDIDDEWSSGGPTVDGNGATIDGADTMDLADWGGFALTFTRRSADAAWLYTYQFLNGAE